jgi:hypothetical protein
LLEATVDVAPAAARTTAKAHRRREMPDEFGTD